MEKNRKLKIFEEIDELIDDGKFAQARKLCDREQKKGDNSDTLLVRKIVIFLSLPDTARNEAGRAELAGLKTRSPPLKDLFSLMYLDHFFSKNSNRLDALHDVWVRAANAPLQEESFVTGWFRTKFDQERWRDAQQAALVWKRNYPKRREPFFLHILCSHLVLTRPGFTEAERSASKMISFMCLAQAAKEVQPAAQSKDKRPPRALHNEEDLLFLISIYKKQGKLAEALSILQDSRTGFASHVSNRSFQVFVEMLQLHGLCHKWEAQWLMCYEVLGFLNHKTSVAPDSSKLSYDFGEQGDDWKIWSAFVTACAEMLTDAGMQKGPEYMERTLKFLKDYSAANPKSRNAALASVKFHSLSPVCRIIGDQPVLEECVRYFARSVAKTSCFKDLQPYVMQLDRRGQESFLKSIMSISEARSRVTKSSSVDKLDWITAEVTVLKFEYHLVVSRDENTANVELLNAFTCNCLRLYQMALHWDFALPPSDRLPGDDAAVLAAMALLRIGKDQYPNTKWENNLLRCIVILEAVLAKSKHNYDALLLLVRLYMYLGAGSLAIERYQQMSIKNIQSVTVSWILFCRISTIHPYPVSTSGAGMEKKTIDPFKEMVNILRWHVQALKLNDQALFAMQTNNQWVSMLSCIKTKQAIGNGQAMPMLLGEACRVRRFRYAREDIPFGDEMIRLAIPMKDTRDRSAFPNYEAAGQRTCEECLPVAESSWQEPQGTPIVSNLDQAYIWDYMKGSPNTSIAWDGLHTFAASTKDDPQGGTYPERAVYEICHRLKSAMNIIRNQVAERNWTKEINDRTIFCVSSTLRLYNIIKDDPALHSFPCAPSTQEGPLEHPCWILIHTMFIYLELCQFGHLFVKEILETERKDGKPLPSWLKTLLDDLSKRNATLASLVWEKATSCRAEVKKQAYFEKLHDQLFDKDDVGQALAGLLTGSLTPRGFCTMLTVSWEDAFDGIIRTKVLE